MKIKDTEYLYASARVRALEARLISRDVIGRMLDAESGQDAAKILQELGYSELGENPMANLERALAAERERTFALLREISPNPDILPVFSIKYDYHNAKTLLKAAAVNQKAEYLLTDAGRVPAKALADALNQMELNSLPPVMGDAIAQARDVLARTGDPQPADFILDRACYEEMREYALNSGSKFLIDYVTLLTDTANLRCAVRALRRGKSVDFMRSAFLEGGSVSVDKLISEISAGGDVTALFSATLLEAAARAGASAAAGKTGFTDFERLCDDALISYMQSARYASFGDAPLIAYLAAKENEITLIRIVLAAKFHGLPAEEIRERLRMTYV